MMRPGIICSGTICLVLDMIFKHRFLDNVTFSEHVLVSNLKNKSLNESNILGNENFQPPFKFCMQLGTQGGCTKMPFLKGAALLLPW